MKKQILLIAALFLIISCDSKTETSASSEGEVVMETTETVEADTVVKDAHADWSNFFADFQSAMKAEDFKKLEALSTGKVFTPEFLDFEYEYLFEGEAKDDFLAKDASDFETVDLNTDQIPGVDDSKDVSDARMVTLNYVYNDGSDTTESAKIYYFAKINGVFRLLSAFIVG